MRRLLFSIIFIFISFVVVAQDKDNEDGKFVLKGVAGLNFSQTALKEWATGGEDMYGGNVYLNGSLERKSGNWLWSNNLDLKYGLTKEGSSDYVKKSSDEIKLKTQLGYSTNNKWFYTGKAFLETQFDKGYLDYTDKTAYISKFFAPAHSEVSLGLDYRPNTNFSVYFSPLAGKLTFVNDKMLSDKGAFGVEKGKKFRAELGASIAAKAEKTIMENVKLISTLDLFSAYETFGNVDIDWDVLINMKVNKFISANINTTIRYDDDARIYFSDGTLEKGPRVQFREIIGVGFAYSF